MRANRFVLLAGIAVVVLVGAKPKPQKKPNPAPQASPATPIYIKSYSLPASKQRVTNKSCAGLLPDSENRPLTADDFKAILGGVAPFSFGQRGPRQLLLYSSVKTQKESDEAVKNMDRRVESLKSAGRFQTEFRIPHAGTLGNLESLVASLNVRDSTVESVGPDVIRITMESLPDCDDWKAFLSGLRHLAWGPTPVQPVARLFYLDAAAVAKALNGSGTTAVEPVTVAIEEDEKISVDVTTKDKNTDKPDPPAATTKPKEKKPASKPAAKAPTVASAPASSSEALVFSEPVLGDDAAVEEKRRIISMLDLPQPEMIVNVWSAQVSSPNRDLVNDLSSEFRVAVSRSNDALQNAVACGWGAVKTYYADQPAKFNQPFYRYISYRNVSQPMQLKTEASFREKIEDFLNYRAGAERSKLDRAAHGICPAGDYCLGYTDLFHPLKPKLIDLLLALIAAQEPQKLLQEGLDAMEINPVAVAKDDVCEKVDRLAYEPGESGKGRPTPVFACFRQQARLRLDNSSKAPTPQGLLQTAVADFLFNYKMATEFPHEFSPYKLSQSANQLNSVLAPLIDGFNRDIAVFQTSMTERVTTKSATRDLQAEKRGSWTESDLKRKKFENYGVVTVRTVSGKETVVDTATQSYLDVTNAPTIPELLSSIKAAESSVPGVIGKNVGAAAAAAMVGALNTTQTTESKIGRGLKIKIVPRSLPGASSAELDIVMNVEESAEPSLFTAGKSSSSNDNLSRVAKHNTTTKMRIESLRIFEISAFSAKLLRSRPRFPLLPLPGLEVPYIGSLVGFPRTPAVEFHNSLAVLSAIVVPTAADLAYGARYEADRILIPDDAEPDLCRNAGPEGCTRYPVSLSDLPGVQRFHQKLINCLSTRRSSAIRVFDTAGTDESCSTKLN